MEWSPQQDGAISKARDWVKTKGGPQVHRIFGFAGTGKTTLAKEVAAELDGEVLYGAFTGKAASVMRRKGCADASTIHSMIYKIDDDDTDTPTFKLNKNSEVRGARLVIIDECSMVDEALGTDLLSFGTKVLVLGDPAQLPPISSAGFFTSHEPDTMLTEVHRQARDNPIIRLSMDIREGKTIQPGEYGQTRILERDAIAPEALKEIVMGADQVICGLNRTRVMYNKRMREYLGRTGTMPVKGDKLICLRNDRQKNIYNGSMWTALDCRRKGIIIHMKVEELDGEVARSKGVQVREEFFDGREGILQWQEKRGTQEFTYGYAITCHKSQGSQWNNVVVFDESKAFREDAMRWKYTAATRAAEKLTMVV